ncbi:acyl-homoserine-lactone synthase [Sphingomonas sp.]|jgi:acyl-homoserine lactone synthase|uniref:acyl-homoserine-lactone synthase n=1 Tax=Sphingomonas sp. TaxID=28214 RepID=UPI002E34F8C0|nr:acyl-homoserine-lactone synthase [Sphingomonas sp.]HEX4693597.1 acyl-homoserine-lactone synthase [Sphingomonas sp.]
MLQFVHNNQDQAPDSVLRGMFAARREVFVDLLKWDVPVLDGKYEIDQFDDEHAHYLILTAPDRSHLASARLLPTIRPHILDSLYPDLCDGPPPAANDVFEITRFCLDRRLRAPARRVARDALVRGLVDHALDTGIARYTAIAELGWFSQILAFGWDCLPLGLPRVIDGATLAAFEIAITPETPARLAAAGIVTSSDTESRRAA